MGDSGSHDVKGGGDVGDMARVWCALVGVPNMPSNGEPAICVMGGLSWPCESEVHGNGVGDVGIGIESSGDLPFAAGRDMGMGSLVAKPLGDLA